VFFLLHRAVTEVRNEDLSGTKRHVKKKTTRHKWTQSATEAEVGVVTITQLHVWHSGWRQVGKSSANLRAWASRKRL